MILLIDNYDSFSYNLVQMVGSLLLKKGIENPVRVVRNDELTIEEVRELSPSHIIISPGPGRPKDAGISEEVVQELKGKSKILGICLGHQGICEAFGANITYARTLVHGKQDKITIENKSVIFKDLPKEIVVGRYHSLAADRASLPDELVVIGESHDGEIMAVKHAEYDIYGLQFHPESVLTKDGETMLENFLFL